MAVSELLVLRGVSKSYSCGDQRLRVLIDVSLEVAAKEIVAVVGGRHEGKTTLLQIAAGLAVPGTGEVRLGDADLVRVSDARRAELLGSEIRWIDSTPPSVGYDMRDSVAMPLVFGDRKRREARELAMAALERVGAAGCARRQWGEVSRWERVMVAFARAIVSRPRLIVMDDVIDGLGMSKTREAGELLCSLVDEIGCGVLMSASDVEAALAAQRIWKFERGKLRLAFDSRASNVVAFPEGARSSLGSSSAG